MANLIIFSATYLPWLLVLFLIAKMLRAVEQNEALRPFGVMFVSFALAAGLAWLLKNLIYFPRPFVANPALTPLIPQVADSSFPSAHAAIFMALAVAGWAYRSRWGVVFLISAVLIGVARVLAHLHFPLDILAGWLLGLLAATCVLRLSRLR